MMPRTLILESFDLPAVPGQPTPAPPAPQQPPEVLAEDRRLAAYEDGYRAGWDDALAAAAAAEARLREDLSQNLRDLSFTFHEARTHLLRGLEPLLSCMVDAVLPEAARATLGAAILAELLPEAQRLAGRPIALVVCPADAAAVARALTAAPPDLPVEVVEDPTQAEGVVHFRFADGAERGLDRPALLHAIRARLADFLAETGVPGADPGAIPASLTPKGSARHG